MNPEDFNQLARTRRSVFPDQFIAGEPIDDAIIEQILINATWAPDHGRSQPWQFSVFTGKGLETFANFQSELYKSEAGAGFKEAAYEKMQRQPLKASHIISIGMRRTTTKNIPEMEDIAAVACAVQNIYLSVTAYGLGGYWTTGGVTFKENAKPFFNLGEADRLMGFFYIGKVAIPSVPTPRMPLEEKVRWVRE